MEMEAATARDEEEDAKADISEAVPAPGVVVSIEHIPSIKVMFGCIYGGKAS